MISLIRGKILENKNGTLIVLTSGGVGYKIFTKPTALDIFVKDKEVDILTFLSVKEDALDLFGFASGDERDLFINLISVSGIGPKGALNLLCLGEVNEIKSAIGRGDVTYLTKVSGIGKKTAERTVVELKDKVGGVGDMLLDESGKLGDVVDGLMAMGYNNMQAREMIKDLEVKDRTSEQLLKESLQKLR